VLSSCESWRPAIAIAVNDANAPDIQAAARSAGATVCDMDGVSEMRGTEAYGPLLPDTSGKTAHDALRYSDRASFEGDRR
jgi:hypothetical protein